MWKCVCLWIRSKRYQLIIIIRWDKLEQVHWFLSSSRIVCLIYHDNIHATICIIYYRAILSRLIKLYSILILVKSWILLALVNLWKRLLSVKNLISRRRLHCEINFIGAENGRSISAHFSMHFNRKFRFYRSYFVDNKYFNDTL